MDALFKGLFDEPVQDDNAGGTSNWFGESYGWIYSTAQVAEHERITLDEAFNLPTLQYLGDLSYIKAKARHEAEQIKDMQRKARQ